MRNRYRYFFFFLLFALLPFRPWAQTRSFWVAFADKAYSPYSLDRPLEFLSQQALDRRQRQGLKLEAADLPVSPAYLDSLRQAGAKVLFTSRWLNAATIEASDSLFDNRIKNMPFLVGSEKVFKRGMRGRSVDQTMVSVANEYTESDYGASYTQIAMHRGDELHKEGFRGQGMKIAVIDAGFYKADTLQAFASLHKRHGILATHDFIYNNDSVYEDDRHGEAVLSVIAGYLPGKLIGTAPEADYFLLRSEISASESLLEEAAWIAAIEWADSAGANVVNSSLGYTTFSDPAMNHTYSDMNGRNTHISRAASMVASKGMILVSSAGNEGDDPWFHISAPADATDILAVGAVDADKNIAKFSSRGPSADGRVKPDVSAMGVHTVIAHIIDGEVEVASGTSSAAPVITGLTACLWQAFPEKSSYQIMDAIRRSAHLYAIPNDALGYGIPNFELASELLKNSKMGSEDFIAEVYPNPFQHFVTVSFYSSKTQRAEVSLFDALGKLVQVRYVDVEANSLGKIALGSEISLPQGLYFVSVRTHDKFLVKKVIRD